MKQNVPYVEPTDSAATIMRGVAAALRGAWMQPQSWPGHLVRLAGPGNHLPAGLRQAAVSYLLRDAGLDPRWAQEVTATGLAQWVVDLYEQDAPPDEQYSAIIIGAANGGAGHLAALLRAPLLSQHFLTRYRYHGRPDDVAAYQAYGAPLADAILARNPDLAVINHYDPVHDRFGVPHLSYVRMKLLELPGPYVSFIERHLRPGGALLFVDCYYPWGQYRIGRRHYFQVGGLGGIPAGDWVNGSPEVRRFLAGHGRPEQAGWSLPYPWLTSVESEWGALPSLRAAVEAFAERRHFRFRILHGGHPEDFARLAYYAAYQAALNAGQEPAGVLVDCFTQTSPTGALAAGLLPLWLPYNCCDSLEFLRQMAPNFPRGKPVLLAPVPSFAPAWDQVSAAAWQAACGPEAQVTWIGVDPAAYPVDLAAMFRFVPALQAWCHAATGRLAPAQPPFTVDDLEALIGSMAAQASVEAAAGSKVSEVYDAR